MHDTNQDSQEHKFQTDKVFLKGIKLSGDAHAKQHHHCKSTGGESYSSAQPAKGTGPSTCANADTISCFHAGEQHTKLDEARQAGQIASSHHTEMHLFKITTTQAESLLKNIP